MRSWISSITVRAKARIGEGWHPSLKSGVNERQFVDDAVALVSRYFGHYSAFNLCDPVFCVFSVFRGFNGFSKNRSFWLYFNTLCNL